MTKAQIERFPALDEKVLDDKQKFEDYDRQYRSSWIVEPTTRKQPATNTRLSSFQNHIVQNQMTHVVPIKPGAFRQATLRVVLWGINLAAAAIYDKGELGGIPTIHFARWVFLDNKQRMIFASNYDGSHEAYMDDFINKAGWGLNLAFNCGLGYPRTRWIIKDGIDDELKFKYTQRRHQAPTETWYRAHPGLTVFDIERNARVRAGFERRTMTDEEVRAWLGEL